MAIVVAAGCGDSGSDSGGTKAPAQASITKAEFIKRSAAFCNATRSYVRRRFVAYRRHLPNPAPKAGLYAVAASEFILPSLQSWYVEIMSLRQPPGDELEIADILRTVELTTVSGMDMEINSGRKLSALFNRSNRLMHRYGIDSCVVTRDFAYS